MNTAFTNPFETEPPNIPVYEKVEIEDPYKPEVYVKFKMDQN